METKIKIIKALDDNKQGVHLRELARIVKTSFNNTSRNVGLLEKEGAIIRQKDANLIKIKLKNHPLTLAYLKQVHTEAFLSLPAKIRNAITDFLNELNEKPLICLLFGSYAKNNFTKNSDIDILLVFQKVGEIKDIENTSKRISMRTNTNLSPVYVNYKDFEKNFLNKEHDFSDEIRQNVILILGVEHYYNLTWRFQQ